MTDPVAATFVTAYTEQRLRLVRDAANARALTDLLGQSAYDEYRELAKRLDTDHLAFGAPKNLIFVPGVMGSLLQSRTRGGIWWIDVHTRDRINQLGLSADGTQDADPANDIMPATTDYSYDPFLAAALAEPHIGHEIFAYDWRKSFRHGAKALRDTVLRLHEENGGSPVHLVAHSMGGLMVRATLLQYGAELWPKLGRIVFIATPHYGATAIAGYLKNHFWGTELMALLGLYLSRETLRSLWGVLGLLPAPRGVYPGTRTDDLAPWTSGVPGEAYVHPCANYDLYQADQWQLGLTAVQSAQLQKILDDTIDVYRQMYSAHRVLSQELRDRMLVIAGVGYQTLFRLAYEPRFFGLWERAVKLTARAAGDPHREGDGRVPLASAMLEDVEIRYVKGVHGGLPNIPAVYLDVFRWLREEPLQLPNSVKGALSMHLAGPEQSEAPHLDGTTAVDQYSDNPGLWNLSDASGERLDALKMELEREALPEFTRVRLL
jgi:pimeloyl-ACP methyl ester carboxylesterase